MYACNFSVVLRIECAATLAETGRVNSYHVHHYDTPCNVGSWSITEEAFKEHIQWLIIIYAGDQLALCCNMCAHSSQLL
jgi:hypothetical protein